MSFDVVQIISFLQAMAVYAFATYMLLKQKSSIWAAMGNMSGVHPSVLYRGLLVLGFIGVWFVVAVPVVRSLYLFFYWLNRIV